MKIYRGLEPSERNGDFIVTVDGRRLTARASLEVRNHSPTGFCWGYAGSGPAQLALAILLDYLGDKERAERMYQRFKFRYTSQWPQDGGWQITGAEIDAACAEWGAADGPID